VLRAGANCSVVASQHSSRVPPRAVRQKTSSTSQKSKRIGRFVIPGLSERGRKAAARVIPQTRFSNANLELPNHPTIRRTGCNVVLPFFARSPLRRSLRQRPGSSVPTAATDFRADFPDDAPHALAVSTPISSKSAKSRGALHRLLEAAVLYANGNVGAAEAVHEAALGSSSVTPARAVDDALDLNRQSVQRQRQTALSNTPPLRAIRRRGRTIARRPASAPTSRPLDSLSGTSRQAAAQIEQIAIIAKEAAHPPRSRTLALRSMRPCAMFRNGWNNSRRSASRCRC